MIKMVPNDIVLPELSTTPGDRRICSHVRSVELGTLPCGCLPACLFMEYPGKNPDRNGCRLKSDWLRASSVFDDTFRDRVAGQPSNIVYTQLVHNLLTMFFDGFDTNAELGSYLLIS